MALHLNGDRGLDRGVGVVTFEGEVFVAEILEPVHRGIEQHPREGTRFASELEAGLIEVVHVEVEIAEGVDEFLGFQSADLRDHHGEQGVGGDVEGDAEEEIRTALVELAAEFAVRDVELDEGMARRERHPVDFAGIPGADDVAAAVGILFEILDDAGDLIDGASLRGAPIAPLRAVDRPEVAVRIGPLVPDRDAVFLEVADVGVTLEEPEQLVNNGAEVQLLGGEQGKSLGQVEAFLRAENGERSRAGSVFFPRPVVEDEVEKSVVLEHRDG